MPRKVPRGRLKPGDVVVVYRTREGQNHHTDRACGLLNRRDGDVERARVGVDMHGGVQVRSPLCNFCDPFYERVDDDGGDDA
jgi:hypothetical protein